MKWLKLNTDGVFNGGKSGVTFMVKNEEGGIILMVTNLLTLTRFKMLRLLRFCGLRKTLTKRIGIL